MTFDLNTLQSGSSYLAERNRWFVVAWSETGLGKSYFSMGFPTPIYILSLETDGPFSALRRKVLKDNLNPNEVFITEAWQQCFDGKPPFIRLQQHYNKMWQFCLDWMKGVSEMAFTKSEKVVVHSVITLKIGSSLKIPKGILSNPSRY